MFKLGAQAKSLDVQAICPHAERPMAVRAEVSEGRLAILDAREHSGVGAAALRGWSNCKKTIMMLPPELYGMGMMPSPAGSLSADQIHESLRWSFSKDSSISMDNAEWETVKIADQDRGGSLLKEHYWIFAVEKPTLRRLLDPLMKNNARMKIEAVDALAMAQRNLCWAEARGRPADAERPAAYASLVVGRAYSALGIMSADGDLLFHKQLEWSESSLSRIDSKQKLFSDLQRNLEYFERRLSAVGVGQGYIFGSQSQALCEHLKTTPGSVDWTPGAYTGIDWSTQADSNALKLRPDVISGDWAWILGSLWRMG